MAVVRKKAAKAKKAANAKPGRGRPPKFKPEYVAQASMLARKGFTDAEMADFFGVVISTFHLWKLKYPEFSDVLKLSKVEADDRVERALFERATGYVHAEDDIRTVDGRIVVTRTTKHYPPDTTAGIFWLKNRRGAEWREKQEGPADDTPAPDAVKVEVVSGRRRADA